MEAVRHVAVLGGGTMGLRIAYLVARGGYPVTVKLFEGDDLSKVQTTLRQISQDGWNCNETDDAKSILGRISFQHNFSQFEEFDLLIEAIPEDINLKQEFFLELEKVIRKDALVCSNSSTIVPSLLFKKMGIPQRSLALHFFLPPEFIPAVEIAPGPETKPIAINRVTEFMGKIGYRSYVLAKESPGLIYNRMNYHSTAVILDLLGKGVLKEEHIDKIFSLGRVSFLWLLDFIGLDIIYNCGLNLRQQLGNRYLVPPFLAKKVSEGELGIKAGIGFGRYPEKWSFNNPFQETVRKGSGVLSESEEGIPGKGPEKHETGFHAVILGGGNYGRFLAALFCLRGADVTVIEPGPLRGFKTRYLLTRTIAALRPDYQTQGSQGRLRVCYNLKPVKQADIVFECIPDNLMKKRQLLEKVLPLARPETPVALSSSFFSVAETLGGLQQEGQNVLGLMRMRNNRVLFDLFAGPDTSSKAISRAEEFLAALQCEALHLPDGKGRPSEVVFAACACEYLRILEEGIADLETVDGLLKSLGTPVDYSFLIDEAGLDYLARFDEHLGEQFGETFRVPRLLQSLLAQKRLGIKVGRGLRTYR